MGRKPKVYDVNGYIYIVEENVNNPLGRYRVYGKMFGVISDGVANNGQIAERRTLALTTLVKVAKGETSVEDVKQDIRTRAQIEAEARAKHQRELNSKVYHAVADAAGGRDTHEDKPKLPLDYDPTWKKPEYTPSNGAPVITVTELPSGPRPLRKLEIWFGGPGTGKTTKALWLCQRLKQEGQIEDYVKINCHEEMTLMSAFKTTKTDENGNWLFTFNKFFNMLTDPLQKHYLVVMDEANLATMSVMKAFQPWFDDTEGEVDFEDKTYVKNPNVNFIFTMNHDDIGISPLPQAVLDRGFPEEFEGLTTKELSKRSGVPSDFIDLLGRIYSMFGHLGNLPKFQESVRKLKNLKGLSKEQFKKYLTSELSLAGIEWQEAVNVSPEFQNLLDEYDKITW